MQRKNYSNEFNARAVKLEVSSDLSMAQVVRDLKVPYEVFRRWLKQFGSQPEGTVLTTSNEHDELITSNRSIRQ
jgi:transposase-like protein